MNMVGQQKECLVYKNLLQQSPKILPL